MTTTTELRALVIYAHEILDPEHSGEHWPDPIEYSTLSLNDQAKEVRGRLDAILGRHDAEAVSRALTLALRRAKDPDAGTCPILLGVTEGLAGAAAALALVTSRMHSHDAYDVQQELAKSVQALSAVLSDLNL